LWSISGIRSRGYSSWERNILGIWWISIKKEKFSMRNGIVHTTPEEFENGGFTLKTHQMFSVHTTPEEFKNATITGHFGFVFEENLVREIT
jgi:hypothetical protein